MLRKYTNLLIFVSGEINAITHREEVKRCTRDGRHEFADASPLALKDCVLRETLTLEKTGSAKEIQTITFEEEKTEALQRITR